MMAIYMIHHGDDCDHDWGKLAKSFFVDFPPAPFWTEKNCKTLLKAVTETVYRPITIPDTDGYVCQGISAEDFVKGITRTPGDDLDQPISTLVSNLEVTINHAKWHITPKVSNEYLVVWGDVIRQYLLHCLKCELLEIIKRGCFDIEVPKKGVKIKLSSAPKETGFVNRPFDVLNLSYY